MAHQDARLLHLIAPDIFAGDAVGNHCLHLASDLTGAGVSVRLSAQRFSRLEGNVLPLEPMLETDVRGQDLLLSYSIHDPFLERLLALPWRQKVCYFHGVTPPELLRAHEPVTAALCERSIAQIPMLRAFDKLVCNSEFNRVELQASTGREDIAVLPPVTPSFPLFAQPGFDELPGASGRRILVLGRVVPHKRIEDAIALIDGLRRRSMTCELVVVGSSHNAVYQEHLAQLVQTLDLQDQVVFKGMVGHDELLELYRRSALLLSASLHEGYCVPVLEAMHLGLPVLVREGTAAVEVGGSAVRKFGTLAEGVSEIERLLGDRVLRTRMVKSGRLQSARQIGATTAQAWMALLELG